MTLTQKELAKRKQKNINDQKIHKAYKQILDILKWLKEDIRKEVLIKINERFG